MADYSAAAGGGLSVGTLTINLSLNTSELSKKLDDTNRRLASMGNILKAEFEKVGGHIGNLGEKIGNVGKSVEKMFGDKAPAAAQKFGNEIAKSLGLSEAKVKGLGQSVEALEGALKLTGIAATVLASPLGAAAAIMAGIAAAGYGVVKAWEAITGKVFSAKGALQEFMQFSLDGFKNIIDVARLMADRVMAGIQATAGVLKNMPGGGGWSAVERGTAAQRVDFAKNGSLADASGYFGRVAEYNRAGLLVPAMGDAVTSAASSLLTPGTSRAEREKAQGEASKNALKAADAIAKSAEAALEARWKAEVEAQNRIGEESARLAQAELDSIAAQQYAADEFKTQAYEDANAMAASYRDAFEVATQAANEIEQQAQSRWQALGSGQIGTALGVSGTGGAILNIAGGAASQYQYTGTVMQGAAAGGQAGGPWGALIGAIVALATQTESFRGIMGAIEEILGGIIPILDTLLKPLAEMFKNLADTLEPVLKIIDMISTLLSQALKPIWSLVEAIGDLFGVISSAIDSIDLGGLTSALDKSVGSSEDQWGKYSVNDWLTGVGPLISELGNELSKKSRDSAVAYDGPSAAAQDMMARMAQEQEQARRDAWDLDPRNPYYALNMQAKALADIEAAQIEAKQSETREAERAADALRELADSVTNAVAGYKIEGAMFRAADSVTRDPAAGNPFA